MYKRSECVVELSQLRYLSAAARLGSFTKAAEREGVAQPAVSKQIKGLEQELGAALFDRRARRVGLTEAGKVAAAHADRVIAELDDLRSELRDLAGLSRGQLRLCATETVMDYLLPQALADLHRRYPGLNVSAEMLGTDDAVALLLADEVDMAIVALPLRHPDLVVEPLFEEDVVLLTPRGDPLDGRASVELSDLRDREFLLSMAGHGLRAIVESACASVGFRPRSKLEVRSQEAIIRLVEQGAGLAFAPRLCATGAERSVHVCAVTSPPLRRRVGWVRRRRKYLPIAVAELVEALRLLTDDVR